MSQKEVEVGSRSTRVNGMPVESSWVQIMVPARFFDAESLLKTTHDYLGLFQIVNIMCEMSLTIMILVRRVRDAPDSIKNTQVLKLPTEFCEPGTVQSSKIYSATVKSPTSPQFVTLLHRRW